MDFLIKTGFWSQKASVDVYGKDIKKLKTSNKFSLKPMVPLAVVTPHLQTDETPLGLKENENPKIVPETSKLSPSHTWHWVQ